MTTMTEEMPPAAPDVPQAPAPAPAAPAAPAGDPAAPWGRTPSGRARSKPLSGRRGRPRKMRTSVIGAKGSQRKAPAGRGPTDYRPALLRMTTWVTLPLAFRAPIDAASIDHHVRGEDTPENPGLARAVSNLAADQPQVAAVLDRILTAGPYAELAAAGIPLVMQLLVNHNRIPVAVAKKLGATDPAEIARQLAEQGKKLAAAA